MEKTETGIPENRKRGYLLKLSGEVFSQREAAARIADEIAGFSGKERLAVLVGGGNYLRGARSGKKGKERVWIDRMGMVGTVLNGMWLERELSTRGSDVVHMSAVSLDWIEPYDPFQARRKFMRKRLLVLSGGTGLPYFSTDTSAVLRAVEIGASRVLKGTRVRGVYSGDPETRPDAEFFPTLSYRKALELDLEVMDQTAFSMARQHDLIVQVFDVFSPSNIGRILKGEEVGTILKRGGMQ